MSDCPRHHFVFPLFSPFLLSLTFSSQSEQASRRGEGARQERKMSGGRRTAAAATMWKQEGLPPRRHHRHRRRRRRQICGDVLALPVSAIHVHLVLHLRAWMTTAATSLSLLAPSASASSTRACPPTLPASIVSPRAAMDDNGGILPLPVGAIHLRLVLLCLPSHAAGAGGLPSRRRRRGAGARSAAGSVQQGSNCTTSSRWSGPGRPCGQASCRVRGRGCGGGGLR